MESRRQSTRFLVAIIASAATAFVPPPRLAGVAATADVAATDVAPEAFALTPGSLRALRSSSRRRRRAVVTRIVPPKVAEYGAYGLAAYSAVELCWWGLPIGYAVRSCDGVVTLDSFLEVAKTPLLAAVFLWPNSWFRNGVSCKIAGALRDAVER